MKSLNYGIITLQSNFPLYITMKVFNFHISIKGLPWDIHSYTHSIPWFSLRFKDRVSSADKDYKKRNGFGLWLTFPLTKILFETLGSGPLLVTSVFLHSMLVSVYPPSVPQLTTRTNVVKLRTITIYIKEEEILI